MVFVGNIKDASYFVKNCDEVWAIVRSLKIKPYGVKQVPELSPSWALFKKYLSLRDNNNWNDKSFMEFYVPQFLREMKSPVAQEKFKELIEKGKNSKIAILCFCDDEATCHRSIIAAMLQKEGLKVSTQRSENYVSKYKIGE